jgi:hypothetical protein
MPDRPDIEKDATSRVRAREGWIKGKNNGWLKPIQKGDRRQSGYRKPDNYVATLHLARKSSPDAMRTLIRLLDDPDGRIAAVAANSVLERAWGKTKEMRPEEGERQSLDVSALTDLELRVLMQAIQDGRLRSVSADGSTDASSPAEINGSVE